MHPPNTSNRGPRCLALLTSLLVFATLLPAGADIIEFDLLGKAGPGLLAGNENATVVGTPGSGGEIGSGIAFDTVTLVLQINIGWGSGNGFTDLTGNATAGHVHGPTAGTPPTAFEQNAPPLAGGAGDLHTRAGWNPNATNGSFQGSPTLTPTQATELLDGRYYINIHTSLNGGGEVRGHLVAVPEPTTFGLLGIGGAFALFLARRRKRSC